MLKLHLGPAIGQSFQNLKCDALVDWQWYDTRQMIAQAQAGADVWPMIRRADANHVTRFQNYRKRKLPITHVMVLNEPFEGGQDGPSTPEQSAKWAAQALVECGVDKSAATLVMGNFLLADATSYASGLRARVLAFADALGGPANMVWGFHPYWNHIPNVGSATDQALKWYEDQLDAIQRDFPRFAITEAPYLHCNYSYRDRDIERMRLGMKRTWEMADERGCYAYGWFIATPNSLVGLGDFVLCDNAGALRPLGAMYRDLVSKGAPPAPPDGITILSQLATELDYLVGYAEGHPNLSNADILARLRDILKRHMEAIGA